MRAKSAVDYINTKRLVHLPFRTRDRSLEEGRWAWVLRRKSRE